jgi:aminoglycoside phosphotransferase family enzyme/predicted kinase
MRAAAAYKRQQAIMQALFGELHIVQGGRHRRLFETHISWVFYQGRYAYKVKKAVNLGFLDFSTLKARRFYCAEEVRINRRLARRLYLGVVPIGFVRGRPKIGVRPACEHAVRMRRFNPALELDHVLQRGRLTPTHMDELAATLAAFHAGLPPAAADAPYGAPAAIRADAMQNFSQMEPLVVQRAEREMLARLKRETEVEFQRIEGRFAERKESGFIRECHGDLHLGNIVLLDNKPTPFDAIEFNPSLRWIDVMSEMAFLMMDLMRRRAHGLAWRLLNVYLESCGDYAGLSTLRFYLAYRAMVRAKVDAIRAHQPGVPLRLKSGALGECRSFMAQAAGHLAKPAPALVITHGLPGSGKSVFARAAAEKLGMVRLRSDVERKRIFGLKPLEDSRGGIYGEEATRRTYARLLDLSRGMLQAGFRVVVDAAFLRHDERADFYGLAKNLAVPFAIVNVTASRPVLERRVRARQAGKSDASEAGLEVLQKLQASAEQLLPGEVACALTLVNDGNGGIDEFTLNLLQAMLAA